MNHSLLFLDIDGVLNSENTNFGIYEEPLDPVNIEPFNRIIAVAAPRIVISSTWRFFWSVDSLRDSFREAGIRGEIIGATPSLHDPMDEAAAAEFEITRGQEIFAWFKEESGRDPHQPDCRFVILDDRTDLEPYLDQLVLTRMSEGLTESHADRVIEMLGEA